MAQRALTAEACCLCCMICTNTRKDPLFCCLVCVFQKLYSADFLSSAKPCYSSPHWLYPKPTVVFWKGSLHVRLGSRSHSSPFCTLDLQPPAFHVFLNLSLFFSPLGLYNQRGEMAPGQLWNYSGNLCRCSSRGGIYLFIEFWKTYLNIILSFHMYCTMYCLNSLVSVSPGNTGHESVTLWCNFIMKYGGLNPRK